MKAWFCKLYADIGGRRGLLRWSFLCIFASVFLTVDLISGWINPDQVGVAGWIRVFLTGLVYGVSFVGLAFFLPRKICRVVFPLTFGWVFLFSVVSLVCRRIFGIDLRSDSVMLVIGSSWDEIKEFVLSSVQTKWMLGGGTLIILEVIVSISLSKCRYFRRSFVLFLLSQLPLVAALVSFPPNKPSMREKVKACTIFRFGSFEMWNELFRFRELINASNNPSLPSKLECLKQKDVPLLGVVIIGESATRNRWSLYGYGRETTPLMDERKSALCVFEDLVSAESSTAICLNYLLSAATKEDDAYRFLLPSVCKRAGYQCVFLSNHTHWGQWDGAETILFKDCDHKFWLADVLGGLEKPRYDGGLLPYVQKELGAMEHGGVAFVHLLGSHNPFPNRYPCEFAFFGNEGESNSKITISDHYDNSIAYTDYVLNEIIKVTESRGGDSFVLYLPDHGESPSAKTWRYVRDRDVWEIPMIAWFSEGYRAHYPDVVESMYKARTKPLVSDQLLFGVTRLLRIEGIPGYTEEADFLSDSFVPRKKRYESYVNLEESR